MKINKKHDDGKHIINEFIRRNKHIFKFFNELNETNILFNYKNNNSEFNLEIDALSILIPHKDTTKKISIIFELKDMTRDIFMGQKSKKIESLIADFKKNLIKYKTKIFYNHFCLFGFLIFLENGKFNFYLFSLNNEKITKISNKEFININTKLSVEKYSIINNLIEFIDLSLTKVKSIFYYLKCFDSQEIPLSTSELNSLQSHISKHNLIYINGYAGTRKTALAFFLFGELDNSGFLLLNQGFYDSVISGVKKFDFKKNKNHLIKFDKYFSFHTDYFGDSITTISYNKKYDYLIIDEYQRCNHDTIELIKNLIKKGTKIILIGDEHQAINPKLDNLLIKEKLCFPFLLCANIYEYNLSECYRMSKAKINFILFLLDLDTKKVNYRDSKLNISIINDYDKFFNEFKKSNKQNIACMATIQYLNTIDNGFIKLEEKGIKLSSKSEPVIKSNFLEDNTMRSQYCFFPYDLISREIESMYIFLPKDLIYDNLKRMFIFSSCFKGKNKFLQNQLYVLFTRATKDITLLIENESTLNWFKTKMEN